jgi:hypothetical protein
MTSRPSDPTDYGDGQPCNSDVAEPETVATLSQAKSCSTATAGDRMKDFHWKRSNEHNGHANTPSAVSATLSRSFTPTPTTMALAKSPPGLTETKSFRRPRHISLVVLLTAGIGIVLLAAILKSLMSYQIEPKGCRMSYMRPSYIHFSDFDTEHTRFATKYSLYLYREQGIDDESKVRKNTILQLPRHKLPVLSINPEVLTFGKRSYVAYQYSLSPATLVVISRFDQSQQKQLPTSMTLCSTIQAQQTRECEVWTSSPSTSTRILPLSMAKPCLTKPSILMKQSDTFFPYIRIPCEPAATPSYLILPQS